MSSSTQNEFDRNAGVIKAEETLRLIASLPAPADIEERVKSGLRAAPRQTSVISWPLSSADGARSSRVSAMRAAAAAAIVFVVAGGGWEVYSHIRPAIAPTAVATPQRIDGGGGLSAAGAKRTPRTLEGPVVVTPANDEPRSGNGNPAAVPQIHRALTVAKSKEPLPAQR
ncbi:MAG: hypothetical protein WBX19_04115 [Terracidiphilus sp.]